MYFRGQYNFLSNFYPCAVHDDYGLQYSCVEAAFQASKVIGIEERMKFTFMDGSSAREMGRKVKLRDDWELVKVPIMDRLLQEKFSNTVLRELLMGVTDEIVEDNTWSDTFWGRCNGKGENILGKLITNIRDYYQQKTKWKKAFTVCFTGPRPKSLYGYNREAYKPLVKALTEELANLHVYEHFGHFISGGAQGFDQLAFWCVHHLKTDKDKLFKVRNEVMLPSKEFGNRWKTSGSPFCTDEFNLMKKLADDVVYVHEHTADFNELYKALNDRNHAMVNSADLVIGLYRDHSYLDPKMPGGTAECLRYAINKNKETRIFSPDKLKFI